MPTIEKIGCLIRGVRTALAADLAAYRVDGRVEVFSSVWVEDKRTPRMLLQNEDRRRWLPLNRRKSLFGQCPGVANPKKR